MSEQQNDGSSLISIGLGIALPTALSAFVGMMTAIGTWTPNESGYSTWFAGLCVGLATGLFPSWFMAWNASVVGVLPDKPPLTVLWGLVPGAVFGAPLGAVFGGVAGLLFGHLLNGAMFGLIFGIAVGVLAWEIGFFASNWFQGRRTAH